MFRFPAGTGAPGQARCAVENLIGPAYPELLETSMLLVSELVTNSVRHAGLGPDAYVELKIVLYDNGIKVDVMDNGVGFSYVPRERALERAGGWGLYMVEQLSHRWGVYDGYPTTVWFELQNPSAAPGAHL